MSAEYEIQKAIFQRLNSSPGSGYTVYDDVPEDAEFPYIVVGDGSSIPFDTKDTNGSEASVVVHSWSRFDGREEVKQIMGEIYDLLHEAEFGVQGHDTILCLVEFQETFLEPDGRTRHGIQRFNLIITEQ